MAEQLARLAERAKFHPDEPTRCMTVDTIVASHAALSRQLIDERAALGESLAEHRAWLARKIEDERVALVELGETQQQLAAVRGNLAEALDELRALRTLAARLVRDRAGITGEQWVTIYAAIGERDKPEHDSGGPAR